MLACCLRLENTNIFVFAYQMKTNAPILTRVALLLATTPWEVTDVSAHLGSPMTSSPMPAMMLMSALLPRTPAVMVAPTLRVVISVAAHLATTELDKGEFLHAAIHQRHIQKVQRCK